QDVSIDRRARRRHLERPMHIVKMRRIDGIFSHFLIVRLDLPAAKLVLRPLGRPMLGDRIDVPRRRLALGVVPAEDQSVHFLDRPVSDLRLGRYAVRVRHLGALPALIEAPSMKRALYAVARHLASITEVRAQMWAVRIEKRGLSRLGTKEDEVAPEILERK